MARRIAEDAPSQLETKFAALDHKRDGTVASDALGTLLKSLDQDVSEDELAYILENDFDARGTFDFDEFLQVVITRTKYSDAIACPQFLHVSVARMILEACRKIDNKGAGFISAREMRGVLEELALKINRRSNRVFDAPRGMQQKQYEDIHYETFVNHERIIKRIVVAMMGK